MSQLIGIFRCPQCLNGEWEAQDWTTYMSIVCARCGHKLGEVNFGKGGQS